MADDKSSAGWGGNFAVLVFAAVSAVYVAWQQPALVSTRPTDADYAGHDITAQQDIDARLWQDPLDAVAREIESNGSHTPQPSNNDLTKTEAELGDDPTLSIAVTVPGAPYPDAAETRRRLRYAVLAALHVAGYMPADERHIGYFRTDEPPFASKKPLPSAQVLVDDAPLLADVSDHSGNAVPDATILGVSTRKAEASSDGSNSGGAPLPATIPFEQFEKITDRNAKPQRRKILVLWLDEDFLTSAGRPVASLSRLHRALPDPADDRFVVLGPQDSTTLAAMAQEIGGGPGQKACLDGFSIYNFGATADEEKILKSASIPGASLEQLFCTAGLRYYRTVDTDSELAGMLACELMRRDPNLDLPYDWQQCRDLPARGSPRDHVVLISDWDTVYGNNLAKTVKEAFEPEDSIGDRPLVTIASYLRGLDGRLPNRRNAERAKDLSTADSAQQPHDQASAQQAVATPETASWFESAEGQSQFDYLRRLAADLEESEAGFLRKDKGHIAAIGVLGSDVYDKLLILQALRPQFPNAHFFTTDLDALLFPQGKSRYTRNLLVASSYGLSLNPDLQADIPPFRSTYQTSIFLATRLAIEKEQPDPSLDPNSAGNQEIKDLAASTHWAAPAVLFQIGRTGAQALPVSARTPNADSQTADQVKNDPGPFSRIQPPDTELYSVKFGTRFGVFLMPFLLIGVVFSFARVRRVFFADIGRFSERARLWRRVSRILAGLFVLMILAGWSWLAFGWLTAERWLTENGAGEPISVFEGISIWPTIALRTFGVLLALFLTWYTVHDLQASARDTLTRFNESEDDRSFGEIWLNLRTRRRLCWADAFRAVVWFPPMKNTGPYQHEDDAREEMAFNEIVPAVSGRWRMRFLRALLGTALMMLFVITILAPVSGSLIFNPARGERAEWLFNTVSLIEVVTTLFLTFLVADATLYSRSFIKRLSKISTRWPPLTIDQYWRRFRLDNVRDLADWIDLRFLAERTRSITKLVYFPFLAWAVLIFSRSPLLDAFSMPLTLVLAQAAGLSVIVGSVVAYRAAAEYARRVACRRIASRIIDAKGRGEAVAADQLERLLTDMQELREGAFAPLSSQPIVKAILLPVLTYGGTSLLHIYGLPGN